MEKLYETYVLPKNGGCIEIVPRCDTINIYNSFLFETVIKSYVKDSIKVIFNLKNVNLITSTSIGMLLNLLAEFEKTERLKYWQITNLTEPVNKIFEITKIKKALPVME